MLATSVRATQALMDSYAAMVSGVLIGMSEGLGGGTRVADKPKAAPATTAAAADKRPLAFAQCVACHAVEPGKHGVGPSLAGVYGTKSGDIAGYVFSEQMKQAGLTWDDATLDAYLTNPAKVVPGTKMTYAGMADAAKRKEVIAYLKTLK